MPSSSAYNVLPGYIGDLTANHYGMNQPRLSQLQTLEAKVKQSLEKQTKQNNN